MKVLIHEEKRQIVDGHERIIAKSKQYFVEKLDKDVSTLYGTVKKEDLQKPSGSTVKTHMDKEFILIDAGYIDIYKRFRKLPQTIPLKDIGLIIAETGINKDSLVLDSGTGSGAMSASLARIAKHVTTYDIREDHLAMSKKNIKMLNFTNIEFKNKSVYDGIDEIDLDLITLDVPQPWKALGHASKALKVGGFVVSYSPSIPQVQDFCNETSKQNKLQIIKTVEIIERQWEIKDRRVRPKSAGIGHSGFITFVRKIKS